MDDDPYSFEPLHNEDDQPKPPPLTPRVSKLEERMWMVAFWVIFIWSLLQFGIAAAMINTRIEPALNDEPFTLAMAWLWRQGMIVDLIIAGVSSLIAMYGFARARAGLSFRRPIVVWLSLRLPVFLILFISFIYLKSEDEYFPRWEMLVGRIFFLDLPVWIFLIGVGLYYFAYRELAEPRPRRPSDRPFAPWP